MTFPSCSAAPVFSGLPCVCLYPSACKHSRTRALDLDPRLAEAQRLFGESFSEKAQYALAIVEYRKALDENPEWTELHYRLGHAYMRNGQKQLAEQEFAQHRQTSEPSFNICKYVLPHVRCNSSCMETIPWHHLCSEKFKACSPVYLPLERFEAVKCVLRSLSTMRAYYRRIPAKILSTRIAFGGSGAGKGTRAPRLYLRTPE